MKDGRIVAERPAAGFTTRALVEAMGSTARRRPRRADGARSRGRAGAAPCPAARPAVPAPRKGEVIGLAGLGGHGQTDMLLALFDAQSPHWLAPPRPGGGLRCR